jgi:hypothetical protein
MRDERREMSGKANLVDRPSAASSACRLQIASWKMQNAKCNSFQFNARKVHLSLVSESRLRFLSLASFDRRDDIVPQEPTTLPTLPT